MNKIKLDFSKDTKGKILKNTIQMIEKNGLSSFSIRKLAARISIDPMAIYYYFPSKEALLQNCIDILLSKLILKIQQNEEQLEKILNLILCYRNLFVYYPNFSFYLLRLDISIFPKLQEFNELLLKEINDLVNNPKDSINIRDVIIDFIHGYYLAEYANKKEKSQIRKELRDGFDTKINFLMNKLFT